MNARNGKGSPGLGGRSGNVNRPRTARYPSTLTRPLTVPFQRVITSGLDGSTPAIRSRVHDLSASGRTSDAIVAPLPLLSAGSMPSL